MGLKSKISDDIKAAMKAQEKDRLQILRMLLSELKYAQANSGNVHEDLPEADEIKVVSTYYKKLDKSLTDYPEGEARSKIQGEMKVVAEYLPKRLSNDEIEAAVREFLQNDNDRQFGSLMKKLNAHLGASADGKALSQVLKSILS